MDAIAEIHYLGTRSYEWVLEADIEACFDTIDHAALWVGCVAGSGTSACCCS
jgi:retron-type reverse transcriptase